MTRWSEQGHGRSAPAAEPMHPVPLQLEMKSLQDANAAAVLAAENAANEAEAQARCGERGGRQHTDDHLGCTLWAVEGVHEAAC